MDSKSHENGARVRALTQEAQASVLSLRGRRVLVLGDAILDEYLTGDCSRISPEAPVPVLRVRSARQVLGGAANTAANVVSLGGRARADCVGRIRFRRGGPPTPRRRRRVRCPVR